MVYQEVRISLEMWPASVAKASLRGHPTGGLEDPAPRGWEPREISHPSPCRRCRQADRSGKLAVALQQGQDTKHIEGGHISRTPAKCIP